MPASIWVDSQVTYGGRTIFFHFVFAFDIMSEYYCSLKALIEPKSKLLVDAGPRGCLPNFWLWDRIY